MEEQAQDPRRYTNVFHGGLVTDIDYAMVKNNQYVDANNIEIFDQSGQGLIAVNQDGNKSLFSISIGYKPVGSCLYQGILYIFSYDETNDVGEIGCFPSPKAYNSYNTEFENIYKPLKNYTTGDAYTGARTNFTTTLFNWRKIKHEIDVKAKQIYDGSVNLYFADGVNPLRCVNTGFTNEGISTDKLVPSSYFPNLINVMKGTDALTVMKYTGQTDNGCLKSGNYFFYLRYLDEAFNRTPFVSETKAISVGKFPAFEGVTGNPGASGKSSTTTKSLELSIYNRDQLYSYYEIAYIRYYSSDDNIMLKECKLLDKYFDINHNLDKDDIVINGYEEVVDIDFSKIITTDTQENIPETIAIADGRLWGANWQKKNKHNSAFTAHALTIKAVPIKKVKTETAISLGDGTVGYNANSLNDKSFFRGETYIFNAHYVFDDGTATDGYPITGGDFYFNDIGVENDKGIVRFPSAMRTGWNSYTVTNGLINYNLLGIRFDMSGAPKIWPSNVKGIYFTVGERIPNLYAQGMLMQARCSHISTKTWSKNNSSFIARHNFLRKVDTSGVKVYGAADQVGEGKFYSGQESHIEHLKNMFWGVDYQKTTNYTVNTYDFDYSSYEIRNVMPIFKGLYPIFWYSHGKIWRHYMDYSYAVPNLFGFFSPDYMLNPDLKIYNGVIKPLGTLSFDDTYNMYDTMTSNNIATFKDINGSMIDGCTNEEYAGPYTYPFHTKVNIKSMTWLTSTNGGNDAQNLPSIENVEKFTTPKKAKKFVSQYKECGVNPNALFETAEDCMFSYQNYRDDHGGWIITNRSMVTPRYLGVKVGVSDDNHNFQLCNIYRHNPDDTTYDIKTLYDNRNIKMYQLTEIYKLFAYQVEDPYTGGKILYIDNYNGDCFLQRSFFKVMGHSGTSFVSVNNVMGGDDGGFIEKPYEDEAETNARKIKYGHGLLMQFITENAINAETRIEKGTFSFYPAKEIENHVVLSPENETKGESTYINAGYNQHYSPKARRQFDTVLPTIKTLFRNRLRYSEKDFQGSFTDKFLSFEELAYKDFDTSFGSIVRLVVKDNWLLSVCESGVLQHFLNSTQIKIDANSSANLMGSSDVIATDIRVLLSYGTTFTSALAISEKAIYGIDYNKKVIWTIGLNSKGQNSFLEGSNLGKDKMCERVIAQVIGTTELNEDIYAEKNVIVEAVNDKVYFIVNDPSRLNDVTTLIYNEKLGSFISKTNFRPFYTINFNNRLLSLRDSGMVWETCPEAKKNTFFNVEFDSFIKFIINPLFTTEKIFESVVLNTPDKELAQIDYSTDKQSSSHVFPVAGDAKKPWIDPMYKEDNIYVPVFPETVDWYGRAKHAVMRGSWLSINIRFRKNVNYYIKSVLTNFRISKS